MAAALLAGCGGSQGPIDAPGAMPQHVGSSLAPQASAGSGYESLYSFTAEPDGAKPEAGLYPLNGVLYGTTWGGGNGQPTADGVGTVFSVTTTGVERVLYSFTYSNNNGTNPSSGLIGVNGSLYGVIGGGGSPYQGIVYTVTTSGEVSVVYGFKGRPYDGSGRVGL